MATSKKKSTKKTKTTKPRATKSKKTKGRGRKGLWGAALKKHNEKLARMGKKIPEDHGTLLVPEKSLRKPVPPHKRLHPPRPPGAVRRPVTPPKRHRTKMVPAMEIKRVQFAMEAKHAADELAEATKDLKKLKSAVTAAKTPKKRSHGRKKFGKRQKAAASAAFTARHGMSPAAYIKSKRPKAAKKSIKNERRVTAKELLAKPGTKTASKVSMRKASTLKGKQLHVWLCAGTRRTGCGGGKKGGHVIGMLR